MLDAFQYDVTVSFAGEDRHYVEQLARLLRRNGVRVFYDAWEQADLWGKDLFQHLDTIYRSAAKYCLIFVSKSYVNKAWTKHELKSAQARAFSENSEYILPIRLDDAELPGLPPTTAYLDARTMDVREISQVFLSKLGVERKIDIDSLVYSQDWEDRRRALSEISVSRDINYLDVVVELMLNDPVAEIREFAAWTLDNFNDSRAYSALKEAIHDPVFGVRSAAGWALVHLGPALVRGDMELIHENSENAGAREMATLVLQNL